MDVSTIISLYARSFKYGKRRANVPHADVELSAPSSSKDYVREVSQAADVSVFLSSGRAAV
jgi:hypothetical protein